MKSESPVVVLKFGGSVLRSESDLPIAVSEIYRHIRAGRRVLAVVSALGATTDHLLDQAMTYGDDPDPCAVAALLATGEAVSVSLLTLALDRAGIRATGVDPRAIGFRARGHALDATPVDLDRERLLRLLDDHEVVVAPGFVAVRDTDDAIVTLGRGGSDLSAVFIAHRIGADRCRLVKDVDGLYESDPHAAAPAAGRIRKERATNAGAASATRAPRRFASIAYEDALRLDAAIIQPKAVLYGFRHQTPFEVGGLARDDGTLVGAVATRFAALTSASASASASASDHRSVHRRKFRVALLGLGTVGFGVHERLRLEPDQFEIVAIGVRDAVKPRQESVRRQRLNTMIDRLFDERPDVLIEAIGGADSARHAVELAIARGVHVISANKALIATHSAELLRAAGHAGVSLAFSAAVGGAAPIIERVRALAVGAGIESIDAVINGTTNFILDAVRAGTSFGDAVRAAQRRGFAEADPTADLSGRDAANKLAILAREAFGADLRLDSIDVTGIDAIDPDYVRSARAQGQVVRLIASLRAASRGKVEAWIRPQSLPADSPLARIENEWNRAVIRDRVGRVHIVTGKGAGRWPTTAAITADLFDLVRSLAPLFTGPAAPTSASSSGAGSNNSPTHLHARPRFSRDAAIVGATAAPAAAHSIRAPFAQETR